MMNFPKNDMQLVKKFLQYISDKRLFSRKDRLLLAVSGGLDSVCLAHLCIEAGFDFSVVHANFNLRGEESKGDEEFVKELAQSLEVPFYSRNLDAAVYAAEHRVSIQVAAREMRYRYFEILLEEKKFDRLLTAHHADDNVETVLMNFLKGTGVEGLKGIRPLRGKICRPLLCATKAELEEYASARHINYREDSSNLTDKYTRNVIRNAVMPVLQKAYPAFRENLSANISRFSEIALLYNDAVERKLRKLLVKDEGDVKLPAQALINSGVATSLLHEVLKEYGFSASQLPEAIKLLHAPSGKFIESFSHRLLKNRGWLVISTKLTKQQSVVVINKNDNEVAFDGGTLLLKAADKATMGDDPFSVNINSALIEYPLLLRKWKTGDYFYPLGMKHKKKLSRFFVDRKLSINEKEKVWVLESAKRILWVVGMRIDERFKIHPNTGEVLKLTLVPE